MTAPTIVAEQAAAPESCRCIYCGAGVAELPRLRLWGFGGGVTVATEAEVEQWVCESCVLAPRGVPQLWRLVVDGYRRIGLDVALVEQRDGESAGAGTRWVADRATGRRIGIARSTLIRSWRLGASSGRAEDLDGTVRVRVRVDGAVEVYP